MPFNGTLVGTPTFAAETSYSTSNNASNFNNCMALNGSSQYMTVQGVAGPFDFTSTDSWTIECRVRTTTSTGLQIAIGQLGTNGGMNFGANVGKAYCIVPGFNAGGFNTSTVNIADGNWHWLALVITSGTSCTLYVDGTAALTVSGSYIQLTGTVTGYVGGWSSSSDYWNGQLDEVRSSHAAVYSSNYTPTTTPFSGSSTTIRALYHLESDGTDSATSMAASVVRIPTGTNTTFTVVGSNTSWTSGTTASISGVTGASISSQSINVGTQTITVTVSTGASGGTLTIADSTDVATTTIIVQGLIAINDANWYFTEYNWYKSGSSYAQTNNPGAYFKVGFSGTSVTLAFSASSVGTGTQIGYTIDTGVLTYASVNGSNQFFSLATGLASGNHTLRLWLVYDDYNQDRWTTPVEILQVTGLWVDVGAASVAPSGTIALLSKRAIVYGDSITEGLQANNGTNDATMSYSALIGDALGAEVSVVGFGGQGWQVVGRGNVPDFYTPGNDTASSWNKYWSGTSRLSSGFFSPPPNYIIVVHGTNDGLGSISDATVEASVSGWLTAVRAAAPLSQIILGVPFGAFKASALLTAFTTYQGSVTAYTLLNGTYYTGANDSNAFLVNLGSVASYGLTGPQGTPTRQAPGDGIHPYVFTNGRLAAMLASAILQVGGGLNPAALQALVAAMDNDALPVSPASATWGRLKRDLWCRFFGNVTGAGLTTQFQDWQGSPVTGVTEVVNDLASPTQRTVTES